MNDRYVRYQVDKLIGSAGCLVLLLAVFGLIKGLTWLWAWLSGLFNLG